MLLSTRRDTVVRAEDTASAEEVTVPAEEYSFDLSATPTAETKSVIKKGSAELIAEAEAPPGKATTVEIKKPIEPGEYAMLCPIGGPEGSHYKLGQLEEFEIQ